MTQRANAILMGVLAVPVLEAVPVPNVIRRFAQFMAAMGVVVAYFFM